MIRWSLILVTAAANAGQSDLTAEEKETVRHIIYALEPAVEFPTKGELAFLEQLVIPKGLSKVFEKNRLATIAALGMIIDYGRPEDSRLAAAYAVALLENRALGAAILMIGKKEYDDRSKGQSYRDYLLKRVRMFKQ